MSIEKVTKINTYGHIEIMNNVNRQIYGHIVKYNQIKGTENSEGRREYRKGKQEDNVIPGNRIRGY